MAKVGNRVSEKRIPLPRDISKKMTNTPAPREMQVSVADAYKEIRDLNRKMLYSFKH